MKATPCTSVATLWHLGGRAVSRLERLFSRRSQRIRKVVGIGLPKTGTTSLHVALEILGYRRVLGFDMANCYQFLHGDIEGLINQLGDADAAEDWPWPLLYQPIFKAYPETLFVLTRRRNENEWLESMIAHAQRKRTIKRPPGMRQHIFGYEDPAANPEHHINYYLAHMDKARRFFSKQGTLVEACWAFDEGWDVLCTALDLPRPEVPFPHVNRRSI